MNVDDTPSKPIKTFLGEDSTILQIEWLKKASTAVM